MRASLRKLVRRKNWKDVRSQLVTNADKVRVYDHSMFGHCPHDSLANQREAPVDVVEALVSMYPPLCLQRPY